MLPAAQEQGGGLWVGKFHACCCKVYHTDRICSMDMLYLGQVFGRDTPLVLPMYAFDEIADAVDDLRQAIDKPAAFRPLYVKIKVIDSCNLRCQMCNHWRHPHDPMLPLQRLHETLHNLAALGCRKVHISGGEPLLRRDVPDLIETATALGVRVNMTSNGTLIEKELARRLISAGLRSINVSLDGPDASTHDEVRAIAGSWKRTTRAITYLRRWAHKGKLTIRVNTVVSRLNYDQLATLPDLVHSLGAEHLNLIPVDDHCGEYLSLKRQQIEEFNALIAPQIAERALALGLMQHESEAYPFGYTYSDVQMARRGRYAFGWYRRHPCFAPWTHSLINYNGDVFVCCMTRDRMPPLGNLHEQSFTDIWQGPAYQAIRQRMHPPDLEPCARCDDFLAENRQILELVGAPNSNR